ncbi:MAG: metallophosphatase family protein [Crocinitomicaceae bacterium]|nr:metallophosphatase family protein [Crocinitomicaceae bacterium]
MTKIGLLSDTHGFLDPKIFKHFEQVDEVWHAGDIGSIELIDQLRQFKPLRIIHGNIDDHQIRQEAKKSEVFEVEGLKIAMTHIAGKPGKYVKDAYDLINKERPDLFVCGHSHILLVQQDPRFKMLWLNPGACGIKGFHKVRTLLRFAIDNGKVMNMEAIELGSRSLI